MIVRLFCPFDPDRFLIIVDVVFVIGMAATAAAFVVASTIGISFSVVMCVEFNRMLGIIRERACVRERESGFSHSLTSFVVCVGLADRIFSGRKFTAYFFIHSVLSRIRLAPPAEREKKNCNTMHVTIPSTKLVQMTAYK